MSLTNVNRRRLMMLGIVGIALLLTYIAGTATSAQARGTEIKHASSDIDHTPHGTTWLRWDPKTEDLTVKITLTGLAPKSTHPAHIHLGVCTSNGPVAYMLNAVVADAAGNATSTTVVHEIENGIPASGWYVNVHNGPSLSPANQFIPIACANITNSDTSLKEVQTVSAHLGSTNAADQDVSGKAWLKLDQETLTVKVTVHGLVPNSTHPEHIHAGSCQNQVPGKIVYMLTNLVADANGNATATTIIQDVESIPASGWYINVHRSTDLSTQTGFDPIACGNVTLS